MPTLTHPPDHTPDSFRVRVSVTVEGRTYQPGQLIPFSEAVRLGLTRKPMRSPENRVQRPSEDR